MRTNSAAASGAQRSNAHSACIKNGFHQFVVSVQITLGGSTVQSSQIFENVNTTYKILSEWSESERRTYGPSLGIALDDYELATDRSNISSTAAYEGLDNIPFSTLLPARAGVQYPVRSSPGYRERAQFLNTSTVSSTTASTLLGSNVQVLGKGSVQHAGGTGTLTAGQDVFVAFYLATIRLADISDCIQKIPLIKNLKGFIYVNYNAASVSWLAGTNGSVQAVPVQQAIYGRCMPTMLDTTAAPFAETNLTFTAAVSAIRFNNLTSAQPAFVNTRLWAPYYVGSPEVDRALSMKKTMRYHERFVTTFQIAANGQFSGTLSPGIANPKRVILCPYSTGSNGTSGVAVLNSNPLLPATTL